MGIKTSIYFQEAAGRFYLVARFVPPPGDRGNTLGLLMQQGDRSSTRMLINQSSIATLYAKEFRNLRRYVRRTLRSSSEAQDIVQEAYLRLLTLPADYPALENPRAFLFVVASHLALDRLRHLRRSERLFLSLSHDDAPEIVDADIASIAWLASRPEDETDAALRYRHLLSSINGLEPNCHRAFVMHKIKELSYKEVACQMGITVSMVEKHLAKALKYLGITRRTPPIDEISRSLSNGVMSKADRS